MPTLTEHKTVQGRIFAYAAKIGWTLVPREEADSLARSLICTSDHAVPGLMALILVCCSNK